MDGIRELKNHIESISDIKKITNAMYLSASSRLAHYRRMLLDTNLYYQYVTDIFKLIDMAFAEGSVIAVVAVTTDKGFSNEFVKEVCENAFEEAKSIGAELYVLGRRGESFFRKRNIKYSVFGGMKMQKPSSEYADIVYSEVLKLKKAKGFDCVRLVYMDSESKIMKADFAEIILSDDIDSIKAELLPDKDAVFSAFIPFFFRTWTEKIIIESGIAEQKNKTDAMQTANENAASILEDLQIQYSHTRQNTITNEIIEKNAGRMHLKKN